MEPKTELEQGKTVQNEHEASHKADVLIEAMKWIREHRGKITVVKLGGSLMEDENAMTHLITDLVFMETVGMKPTGEGRRSVRR